MHDVESYDTLIVVTVSELTATSFLTVYKNESTCSLSYKLSMMLNSCVVLQTADMNGISV
jgi:hypothetical protein